MAKSISRSDRLIEILRRPDLPYSITAEWVAREKRTGHPQRGSTVTLGGSMLNVA